MGLTILQNTCPVHIPPDTPYGAKGKSGTQTKEIHEQIVRCPSIVHRLSQHRSTRSLAEELRYDSKIHPVNLALR